MINTSLFKTRTEIVPSVFPSPHDIWPVGLDIGYSGVKGICPNKKFCFPSYAKKIQADRRSVKDIQKSDICYRDDSGTWVVGEIAYAEMTPSEVSESEAELYGRNRYYSRMFTVIARTGIAMEIMGNNFGSPKNRKLAIQTGLPPKYEKTDSGFLKDALTGRHIFELKVGRGSWETFDFTIKGDDILIMPQPLGALISASIGIDGRQVPEARKYFNSNVIVSDPGFGTYDDYTLRHGNVVGWETFPNLGMKEVFERTCKGIMETCGVEITVSNMQNILADGMINIVDRKTLSRKKKDFAPILERSLHSVCDDVISKMMSTHDFLVDTDYIIATGGTYDAWKEDFDSRFKDMEGLRIIPANINDLSLPNVYSNARGYYFNIAARSGRRV